MRTFHPRPLVSLVLPTRTRPAALRRAVESVLAQTYENIELIVVNDGGDSVDALLGELDKLGNILQVRLPQNRGVAAARNHGLRLARGEYVGFLDDDDTLDPTHVTTLVSALSNGTTRIAYANSRRQVEVPDGDDVVVQRIDDPCPEWSQDHGPDAFLIHNPLPVQAVMLHRSCLEECGSFDESLPVLEDWELWLRLSRNYAFFHVETTTSTVNWRPDGVTRRRGRDFLAAARRILARYAESANGRPDILAAQETLLASLERLAESHRPSVSVIVPFKSEGRAHVRGFLASLGESLTGTSCEIIALDRGLAPDAAAELVTAGVRSLQCDGTLAQGLAQATATARAPELALVRSDVLFESGWLNALRARAAATAGQPVIIGAKTLSPAGLVDHVGLEFRRIDGTARSLFRGVEANATELEFGGRIEATASGAVLVPLEIAKTVGFGSIDGWACIADLCLRARIYGIRTEFAPRSTVYRLPERRPTNWLTAEHNALLAVSAKAMHAAVHGADLVRARDELGRGNHAEAELFLEKAAANPSSSKEEIALLRAVEHLERGNCREAVEVLEHAFANGPEGYSASLSLGVAYLGLNRPANAWAVLEPLARRHPEDDVVVHELYRAGLAIGKWRELADALERYVATHPHDNEKRYALTSVSLRAGRTDAARAHYEHLRTTAPTLVGLDLLGRRLARAA